MLLFCLVPLCAGGGADSDLSDIDALIDDSRYNEAIMALSSYIERYPEKFDAAQTRMRRILRTRSSYNAKAQDLLNLIEHEPENDAKALGMIHDLEQLEKNPTERTQQFLKETKETAQFTFYRSLFERIMRDGQALIDNGRYQEALAKYAEGFVIYRDEFESDYDPALVIQVNTLLKDNERNNASFTAAAQTLQIAAAAVQTATAAGSDTAVNEALNRYESAYRDFMRIRNTVAGCGWRFEQMFADILKDRMFATETSFLPFAYRFVLGRGSANRLEGQAGVFDVYAYKTQDTVLTAVYDRFSRTWSESSGLLENRDAYRHADTWQRCRAASDAVIAVYRLYEQTEKSPKGTSSPSGFTGHGLREEYSPEIARYQNVIQLCDYVQRSAGVIGRIATAAQPDTAAGRVVEAEHIRLDSIVQEPPILARAAVLVNARDEVITHLDSAKTLTAEQQSCETRIAAAVTSVKAVESVNQDESDTVRAAINTDEPAAADIPGFLSFKPYESYLEHFLSIDERSTLDSYRDVLTLYNTGSVKIADDLTAQFDRNSRLADGVRTDTGDVFYYPQECLDAMNRLSARVAADRRAVQIVLNRARSVPQRVLTAESYAADVALLQACINRIDALSSHVAAYQEKTAESVRLAAQSRQEADRHLSDARRALARDDFDRARNLLERASERYTHMLSIQNSDTQRKSIDETLLSLGGEITRKENDAVVRDVRNFLTAAKNAYFAGDFLAAEDTLADAESRWSVTNVEPNGEIAHWKGIVNTALSLKTGRTIPITAPLYPDMSQLLSLANQYYMQGKAAMEHGDRAAGRSHLENARRKLDEVKMVYPLNQDASLLTLRIDQVIDPVAFDSLFQRRYEEAMQNYRNPSKQQEAYSDLLDLSEIDPGNKKLKRDIYTVELYLGIKIPPPNPADLRTSKTLTAEARKTINANNRTMFSVALTQLDKAISLDSNNSEAVLLKDRLQTMIGGESVVVLSSADEDKYQKAVSELQKGNTIVAASYVQQLLNNPRNKNSTKIRELEDRIKARL